MASKNMKILASMSIVIFLVVFMLVVSPYALAAGLVTPVSLPDIRNNMLPFALHAGIDFPHENPAQSHANTLMKALRRILGMSRIDSMKVHPHHLSGITQ